VTQRQADSKWTVEIEQQDNLVSRLIVAVRSTGRIVSADGGLIMDDRWTVRMAPAPAAVHLVGANEQPATSVKSSAGSCPHALAILELDQRVHAWQVLITKSEEAGPRPKPDAAR
jgi:hypothetical protein